MDLGYDAYLDRKLEEHARSGYEADQFAEQLAARALEIGNDAADFLAWIAGRAICLSDIKVVSPNTGKRISARTALIANAPTWLRETVLEAGEIDDEALMDLSVALGGVRQMPADQCLIELAPQWLRSELVDWLAKRPELEVDVRHALSVEAA